MGILRVDKYGVRCNNKGTNWAELRDAYRHGVASTPVDLALSQARMNQVFEVFSYSFLTS